MAEFSGVKVALVYNDKLVMIHRDNKPGINFPGLWDCPGGDREGNESPIECAQREIEEELGIHIEEEAFTWQKTFQAMHDPNLTAYFMAAVITEPKFNAITFGNEGQGWKLMSLYDIMKSDEVVPPIKGRLQAFVDSQV